MAGIELVVWEKGRFGAAETEIKPVNKNIPNLNFAKSGRRGSKMA